MAQYLWIMKKSADLYKELKKDCIQKEEEVPDPDIKALLPVAEHLKDEFAPIDVDSETLQDQNADYIGWIYIPDTDISYPVVKSSDNADYLHTDFNKKLQFSGNSFYGLQMPVWCIEPSQYLVRT